LIALIINAYRFCARATHAERRRARRERQA